MSTSSRLLRAGAGVALLLLTSIPTSAFSQSQTSHTSKAALTSKRDTVVVAGPQYEAGSMHRFFLGDGYRDLWTTPIRVPMLDLRTFAGGLRPLKLTGGNQTKSLRLEAPDGVLYVFRLVDKSGTSTPKMLKGTFVDAIVKDQISTANPGGAMVAARLLDAARVLHVTPILTVMPDDSLLGEFREDFAGKLGMIEEYPGTPEDRPGFAGAVAVIDSDTLLALINRDPEERIDVPAMLAARLMDMFLGDWDRHGGNWRWARKQSNPKTNWLPVPRDRDKVFISAGGGLIPGIARVGLPMLVRFDSTYHSARGLTINSLEFDRRLLIGLERSVWDSVTQVLQKRITDAVIEKAVLAVPEEYHRWAPELAARLKVRRDSLSVAADNFYRLVNAVADVHATDANDRARVTRVSDGVVEVRLESGGDKPYFRRRFNAQETSDVRVYLHGGADTALITGTVKSSMRIRVIGGNGDNQLIDSSLVNGKPGRTGLYDVGLVDGVEYGPDTNFNREPWVLVGGEKYPPGKTRGQQIRPSAGLRTNRELGFIPSLGLYKVRYGFGRRPYSSSVGLEGEYSTGIGEYRLVFTADQRYEGTPVHFLTRAQVSRMEIISFYGLGNETAGRISETGPLSTFFDVRQRQWLLYPAMAMTLGPRSDISLGPTVQYVTTDSVPNRFISTLQPYGFGSFGQAGLRLQWRLDGRDRVSDPRRGVLLDVTGSVFPAVWDVESPFGSLRAAGRAYLTLPIPVHPILVFRAGGAKVFGEFPFHEAAFIGGPGSLRSIDAQRYAGDASAYGSFELRVPLGNFTVLLPWNVGVFGVVDAGRVWVDGESPGGWHSARGIGFWVGVFGPTTAIRFCRRPGDSGAC